VNQNKFTACDLVINGGGIAGCMAAVKAAESGFSVAIVEKRAYLGREISAYNHTFTGCGNTDEDIRHCPETFRQLFRLQGNEELILPEGLTRQILLKIIETKKIPVIFETESVGVTSSGGNITGLVVACPAGLGLIPCKAVFDLSERNNLVRILTGMPYLEKGCCTTHTVFEMKLDSPFAVAALIKNGINSDIPGISPGSMRFHKSLCSDTVVVEYSFLCESSGCLYSGHSEIEALARRKTLSLAQWLRQVIPAFNHASLSHMSYECVIVNKNETIPKSSETGYANIYALQALPWGFSIKDIVIQAKEIDILLRKVIIQDTKLNTNTGCIRSRNTNIDIKNVRIEKYQDSGLNFPFYSIMEPNLIAGLPVYTCDVCIAGVGAGGGAAMAAIAAESRCNVVALEINHDVGGTHTVGKVCGYYSGHQGGINEIIASETENTAIASGFGDNPGGFRYSSYIMEKMKGSRIRLITGTRICGAVIKENRLTQVLAANEDGLFTIEAFICIDSTGDADLAAFAGASYRIGDDRDGMLQSFSMWGTEVYNSPSFLSQRYLKDPGIFHPDLLSERLRAVSVAHKANSPDHISPMLTPRESRRIGGDDSLTLSSLLSGHVPEDTVAVATTQADSHAFTSSELTYVGGINAGKKLRINIPYGCFLPHGIDGLLVAGKAISGERDATSFCRMNADIKNAGYAIGLAAAMSVKLKINPRNLKISPLQARLKELQILPSWAFTSGDDKQSLEEYLFGYKTWDTAGFHLFLNSSRKDVIQVLESCFKKLEQNNTDSADIFISKKAFVCMALAWHGSQTGADFLSYLLDRSINEGRQAVLPRVKSERPFQISSYTGIDDFSIVNRLIVCAGRSGSQCVSSSLFRLATVIQGLGDNFNHLMPYDENREDMISFPFYHRLKAFSYAIEKKADKQFIPPTEKILRIKGISGNDVSKRTCDTPHYMLAHLEICLARAAARCGSKIGAGILIRFLDDRHVFFRKNARQELCILSGKDHGSPECWGKWLANCSGWEPVKMTVCG